jgi:pilus assembly protein FimV
MDLIDQLKGLFHKDKFEKELKEALEASQTNPGDLRLKIRLGEVYFKRREVPQGIAVFREVAESYVQEGFSLKAVAIYKNMIRMSPGSVEFNEKLAELYEKLGMLKDSINQYLIVINYYQNHHEKEKILESARKMVAVDPQDVQNRMRLAEIYFNQGLQDEALKEYEEIGNQLKEQGGKQLGLLIDVLEKIFFRRPKDKNLLRELCILYLKNHNPQAAMKKIEKYKVEQEGDFKKIYDKAKEMIEFEQKREEQVSTP